MSVTQAAVANDKLPPAIRVALPDLMSDGITGRRQRTVLNVDSRILTPNTTLLRSLTDE